MVVGGEKRKRARKVVQKGPTVDSRVSSGGHVGILFFIIFFRKKKSWGLRRVSELLSTGVYSSPPVMGSPRMVESMQERGG
jgi:hypothetical protein